MEQFLVLSDIFNEAAIDFLIKIFLLVATGLFVVFSFLTIRQANLMNQTILNSLHFEVRFLAYFQFFLGIGVFLAILFL